MEHVIEVGSKNPMEINVNGEFVGPNANRMMSFVIAGSSIEIYPFQILWLKECSRGYKNKPWQFIVIIKKLLRCTTSHSHFVALIENTYFIIIFIYLCRSHLAFTTGGGHEFLCMHRINNMWKVNANFKSLTSHAVLMSGRPRGKKGYQRTTMTFSLNTGLQRSHGCSFCFVYFS